MKNTEIDDEIDNNETVEYQDEDGNPTTESDLEDYLDNLLAEENRVFLKGSDGGRYLVSIKVSFVRSDED